MMGNEEEIGIVEEELHTKRELSLVKENERLRIDLERARKNSKMPKGLAEAKKILQPIYDALKLIFEQSKGSKDDGGASNPAWQPWLEKAGNGARRNMLTVVIERGEVTRSQLATLACVSIRSSTFRNGLSWMRSNKLVSVEGDVLRRAQL